MAQYVPPSPTAIPHPDERAPRPSDAVVEEEERPTSPTVEDRRAKEKHQRHLSLLARILRRLRLR